MIIHGKHKRYKLAERHRKQLANKYGSCRIVSRRNKVGDNSNRGHSYRFQVPNKNRHFLIVVEYHPIKGKPSLRDIVIVYKAASREGDVLGWLYKQDVPQFVFDSEVIRFAKGKFTNEEYSWKIRKHIGDIE